MSAMVGLWAAVQQTQDTSQDNSKSQNKKDSTSSKKASNKVKKTDKNQNLDPDAETNARPLTEKERKRKEAALRKELETPYRKWLNEDVAWIITDEERAAFKRLQTDEEREQFIEQFWLRRDPTPDTVENEYKEEHYRRIAYANEHFASGIPGWKTDRGQIYIKYGPPDEIEDHSSGGFYERPPEEGGGETSTFPFQQWRYRYIEGIGTNVIIEFVDTTMSGEFRMTMDPSEKDALLYVPGAGLTLMEEMGLSDKTQRFNNTDGTHLGQAFGGTPESMNEFTRLDTFAKLQRPPEIKYKDLEAEVTSKINYNLLPMRVRAEYFPITDASVQCNFTVEFDNKDLQFTNKEGYQKAVVHILGSVTSMTRRPIANFEEETVVTSPTEYLSVEAAKKSIYQKSIPLMPGTYRLKVIVKDITAGNLGHMELPINVPRLDPDKVAGSSLVLADLIEKVPMRNIGTGMFVIGDSKVRPRMNDTFRRDEKLWIYMKIYHLQADETTHRPVGTVQYELFKAGSNEKIIDHTEDFAALDNLSSTQATIEKGLSLGSLPPGQYTIRLTVTDKNRNQVFTAPDAKFTVI
ncbi:MAG TPA: GWxTD domain-containing protein [Verrucomicrobiae bacterium]|nr:GWxTD domain-containing protein [Verrucomicrobiae bacterium]